MDIFNAPLNDGIAFECFNDIHPEVSDIQCGVSIPDKPLIFQPGPNDVLYGRGPTSWKHTGNIKWRAVIDSWKVSYNKLTCKKEKKRIAISIVESTRDTGGRFLDIFESEGEPLKGENNQKVWYDVGDQRAIAKTAQALRENAPKIKKMMLESQMNFLENGLTITTEQSSIPVKRKIGDVNQDTSSPRKVAKIHMTQSDIHTIQQINPVVETSSGVDLTFHQRHQLQQRCKIAEQTQSMLQDDFLRKLSEFLDISFNCSNTSDVALDEKTDKDDNYIDLQKTC